jgi:hypothetical protein
MINKDRLIEQAKNLGFISEFLCNKPYKYNSKEKLRWLFWMCELQQWFRNKHNIYIEILFDQTSTPKFCFEICKYKDFMIFEKVKVEEWYLYRTYEECLEESLKESLKLI